MQNGDPPRLYHFWLYHFLLHPLGYTCVFKSVVDTFYCTSECFKYFLVVRNSLSLLSEVVHPPVYNATTVFFTGGLRWGDSTNGRQTEAAVGACAPPDAFYTK